MTANSISLMIILMWTASRNRVKLRHLNGRAIHHRDRKVSEARKQPEKNIKFHFMIFLLCNRVVMDTLSVKDTKTALELNDTCQKEVRATDSIQYQTGIVTSSRPGGRPCLKPL